MQFVAMDSIIASSKKCPQRADSTGWLGLVFAGGLLMSGGCRTPAPSRSQDIVQQPSAAKVEPSQEVDEQPIQIQKPRSQAIRWLYVARAANNEPTPSVTGTFDAARNKIEIRTKGVREFVLDTEQIDIDWNRLVILAINGRNSELRHYDFTRLRFAFDPSSGWHVVNVKR